MNKTYQRYLTDETFRASIAGSARRERNAAVYALLATIGTAFRAALRRPKLRRSRMIHRSAFG